MKKNEILKALVFLTRKEQEEISTRLNFLLSSNKKTSSSGEELFYMRVSQVLNKELSTKEIPYYIFKKSSAYKKLKDAFTATSGYMKNAFKGSTVTRPQQQQFYMLATLSVLDDLSRSPIPTNMTTVLQTFRDIAGLMDRAFPGYSQSGLMPMVLKAKFKNKKGLPNG